MTTLLQAVMAATLASNGVADPPPEPLAERFDVLGVQVCLGALDDGKPCDLRLLAPKATPVGATKRADASKPVTHATTAQTSTTQTQTHATMMRHPQALSPAQATATTTTGTTATHQGQAAAPKLEPFEISLLGRTVCLGHPSGDARCDVTLFPTKGSEATG